MRIDGRSGPLTVGLVALLAHSAARAGVPGDVKAARPAEVGEPAGERRVNAEAPQKPPVRRERAAFGREAASRGKPTVHGPRIPEALAASLRARLDARVDADLAQSKRLRADAVTLLTTFIAETPRTASEMPEALVRLGELQWENERDTFVERFQSWEKGPRDQRGPTPELDYRTARSLFARVLRDYPSFDQYDVALYVDGFLASEQGNEEEARQRFERILREYPRSRFVPDAHMAEAEALFAGKYDFSGALDEYEKVLSFKGQIDPGLYGLALFKTAWCYWRLGKSEEAARRFVAVFEATDERARTTNASAGQQGQLDELQGEALKYVVEVFAEDEKNTAQDLYSFLAKIGGERFSGRIVRALAVHFYDQAHYERGIQAYELLLRLEPRSSEAWQWMLQIAAGFAAIEDWPRLTSSLARAASDCTSGGAWARVQSDSANVTAASAAIERTLRENATSLHAKAQRDRTSRAEFEGAAGLYQTYLDRFPREPRAYEAHFRLGEIDFFRLQRNTDAATHYLAAAEAIPVAEVSGELATMRHDALYNALVALTREMAPTHDRKQQNETGTDRRYAEALDLYARLYPNDPQLPAMFYRQGRYYFDDGNYDSAVRSWGALLEKFPSSQSAREAGDSILESFSRAKNYENIETWGRRLKALPVFADGKQQERLDGLIVQAVFKQGEQKAAAGDHPGAAHAYLRAARDFPRDGRAGQACVNAEQEARLSGDVKTLQEAAQLSMSPAFRDRPESPLGAWIGTTTLQSIGLFGEAATLAEQMASFNDREHPHYARFEHEKDASYNAVVLREATGEHDRAVHDGEQFLVAFGSAPEADDVVFQMGRAQLNAGRVKDAVDLYERYLARAKNIDHRAQGLVLLAMAQTKSGDERGATLSLEEAVTLGRHRPRDLGQDGKFAAAHARYLEGERVLSAFERIRIQGDVKQLRARLRQKTGLLKEAAKTFIDCITMGVAEWTTAALYQIGHMYESFAKALRDSPAPADVQSEEQKADYQSQIEEFAVPMEERSLDAYENGWKKATELGIYNQWTAKMRDALGRLNSELYPAFRETGFEVRSEGPQRLPALLDAPGKPLASDPMVPVRK
ncbi:MAG: tetratricopeptide repeat protein [Myxococcota bacterium]|nr:tetratricopeptide repeat protein [Myxococcota bacterium]